MIPQVFTEEHILQATARIDKDGIAAGRNSRHYDLVIDGKTYPPKYVISLAVGFATGKEHPAARFNAVEAKNYFISRNYDVIDRRDGPEKRIAIEDDGSAFPEGRVLYAKHRKLERDSALARKAKARRLAETGKLCCEVCTVDFLKVYETRGDGFIEAHHKKPVSSLDGTEKTKVTDLALVCSNCHRMLHRGTPLLSVEQLKEIYLAHVVTKNAT